MRGTWIAISAAHARAHRLYGVRGWLIAVLWLNTLPVVQGGTVLAMQWMHGAVPRVAGVVSAVRLLQVVLPVGLLSAAFMRLRWFAPALFAFGLLQLLWAGYLRWQGRDGDPLALALVGGMEVLIPVMTMAYATWSRRLRVTYRHEVHADDPALAPAGLDRPARGESPTDATEHARERAALRRVAHELTTGMLDTETWMHVMRHHAAASDSDRTTAYVRARMAVLCPPAHVHPPVGRTLATGLGALAVSVLAAAALAWGLLAARAWLPEGTVEAVESLAGAALLLSWLGGLFAGARFLRQVA